MNEPLFNIKNKEKVSTTFWQRTAKIPLVHKFFFTGLVFGLVGSLLFGTVGWLMLSGQIVLLPTLYLILKNLHAVLQINFFMGIFIVGFYLQSGPKLLDVKKHNLKWSNLFLVVFLLAGLCILIIPHFHIHRYLLALTFFGVAGVMAYYTTHAAWHNKLRVGALSIYGLCALGFGSLGTMTDPELALVVFWSGVMAVVFAVSQQFIILVLGGKKLSVIQSVTLILLFVISSLAGAIAIFYPSSAITAFKIMGLFAFITTIYFFLTTGIFTVLYKKIWDPLGLAFLFTLCWSAVGGILLYLVPTSSDATLHIWAIGVATTLIIAVSSRVLGVLSGKELFSQSTLWYLILLWQVVTFGRGLAHIVPLPYAFAWVTSLVAIIVMGMWAVMLTRRIFQVFKHYLNYS